MTISALVEDLKANGQDFEFYPTTAEIIEAVCDHFADRPHYHSKVESVLDIGAGNGAFLKAFGERFNCKDLLAIEKSPILMAELVKFAKVIGTDFHAQTFLSKRPSVLYCNPPYSEFAHWTARLIKECPCPDMYIVIPRRWAEDETIKAAITYRNAKVTTVGSFDFEDGDRRARAKVDVLYVHGTVEEDDLFKKFFFTRFPNLKGNLDDAVEKAKVEQVEKRAKLVKRDGLIGALVQLYDLEMDRIQTNYDKAASMDAELLRELGLSVSSIVDTLWEKLGTLKDTYWTELFTNLDSVTRRLTRRNRDRIMTTLGGYKSVDFTADNIYAVLLWVLEHANQYIDEQILQVFDDMLDHANMHNYKSNQKVYAKGSYRYSDEKPTHVSLDFRIVLDRKGGISKDYDGRPRGLSDSAASFIMDLMTVANLLGISCATDDPRLTEGTCYGGSKFWSPGKSQLFTAYDGSDLLEVRAFLNGNLHIRMSQKLVFELNIAVGKLRGWIRDHREATAEFGEGADVTFAKDLHVTPKQFLLMPPKPAG